MAHVKPDNPDITRTFAICPATSLPGQTGHIPLGMSACPVSGPEEMGRWRKAIERRGWKTTRHGHESHNARDCSHHDVDGGKTLASATEWSVLQVEPWPITVSRRTNELVATATWLPSASRSDHRLCRRLNLLRFPTCTRYVPVIGSSETRKSARNACNRTVGKKTRVWVPGGRFYWPARYSTFPFSHAPALKTLLHFGHRIFWAAGFEKLRVYK